MTPIFPWTFSTLLSSHCVGAPCCAALVLLAVVCIMSRHVFSTPSPSGDLGTVPLSLIYPTKNSLSQATKLAFPQLSSRFLLCGILSCVSACTDLHSSSHFHPPDVLSCGDIEPNPGVDSLFDITLDSLNSAHLTYDEPSDISFHESGENHKYIGIAVTTVLGIKSYNSIPSTHNANT